MSTPTDRQLARSTALGARRASTTEQEAEGMLIATEDAQLQQAALAETSPLESRYSAALAAQLEAKHEQVERIEDRLEALIDRQEAEVQRAQSQQPGLLALPGTRAKWQFQLQRQQAALQRLHDRLENIREIKDGMGVHAPKIEELSSRKLRLQEPALAGEWDEMREAARRHQALMRKQEQEQQRQRRGEHIGQVQTLGLSQVPR